MTDLPTLTLYGHSYCHLCANMQLALEALASSVDFQLELVDIEDRPDLERKFGDFVPVLYLDDAEICHYVLDEEALLARLKERETR